MEAEGGKESTGGRRKGGRVIEEGGREGGGAMEGWGARPHLPGLIVARVRSCVLAVVRGRSSRARSSSFVSIRGRASSCVGVRLRLWAAGFVRGCAFQCGTLVVGWWFVVAIRVAAVWWLVACRLSLWVM